MGSAAGWRESKGFPVYGTSANGNLIMKVRSSAPFVVSALTLLATSLGVAGATEQGSRSLDREGDSPVTTGKDDRPTARAAESRQIKGENLDDPRLQQSRQIKGENLDRPRLQSRQIKGENLDRAQLQSRQIKGENLDRPQLQSRQLKMESTDASRPEARQIENGPAGDGG